MFDADRPVRPLSGRLGHCFGTLLLVYVIVSTILTSAHLILLLNGLGLSVSAGVSTAYLPVAARGLRRLEPSRGDVLGIGIFLTGLSDVALRLASLTARDFGWPAILNSGIAALSIFLGIMALIAFLWAPYGDAGQLPREKWGVAGLVVAIGVAVAFVGGIAHDVTVPAPLFRLQ